MVRRSSLGKRFASVYERRATSYERRSPIANNSSAREKLDRNHSSVRRLVGTPGDVDVFRTVAAAAGDWTSQIIPQGDELDPGEVRRSEAEYPVAGAHVEEHAWSRAVDSLEPALRTLLAFANPAIDGLLLGCEVVDLFQEFPRVRSNVRMKARRSSAPSESCGLLHTRCAPPVVAPLRTRNPLCLARVTSRAGSPPARRRDPCGSRRRACHGARAHSPCPVWPSGRCRALLARLPRSANACPRSRDR